MTEILVTPATATVRTIKGDTAPFTITISEDSSPIDLTGSSMRIQLRYPINDNVAVTLTSADDISLGGGGVATIDPTNINALDVGDYRWDCQWTNSSSVVRTVLSGVWEVRYEATTD